MNEKAQFIYRNIFPPKSINVMTCEIPISIFLFLLLLFAAWDSTQILQIIYEIQTYPPELFLCVSSTPDSTQYFALSPTMCAQMGMLSPLGKRPSLRAPLKPTRKLTDVHECLPLFFIFAAFLFLRKFHFC